MGKTMDELYREVQLANHYKRLGVAQPDPELAQHAEVRNRIHAAKSASHRPLSKDYEYIGLAGEQAFARFAGTEPDLSLKPHGSGSINATINGISVNVFTARIPKHLLVEQRKARADVYVLAGYSDTTKRARLIGWATKAEVTSRTPRDVGGFGIKSHAIPATELRPMDELLGYLGIGQQTLFG